MKWQSTSDSANLYYGISGRSVSAGRRNDVNPEITDRFEFFIGGLKSVMVLAN